jgi:hypothetical protein
MDNSVENNAHWQHESRQHLVRELISAAIGWAICHVADKDTMDASERYLLDAVNELNKSVP